MTTLKELILEAPSSKATELIEAAEELLDEVEKLRLAFKVDRRSDAEEKLRQITLDMRRKTT